MKYMDIMPLTRKAEFDFLMAMRKPQTKIHVENVDFFHKNLPFGPRTAVLSAQTMLSAIDSVQTIQGVQKGLK